MAFVPSNVAGTTVLPECYTYITPEFTTKGHAIPLPLTPASSTATTAWNQAELVHGVGLPVTSDESGRPLVGGEHPVLHDLQKLYGEKVIEKRVQKHYVVWRDFFRSRVLLDEVDTAFGRNRLHPPHTTNSSRFVTGRRYWRSRMTFTPFGDDQGDIRPWDDIAFATGFDHAGQ